MCLWNVCGRFSYHLCPVFIFFLVQQVLSHLFYLMWCNLVSLAQVHGEAAGGQAAGVSVSAAVRQERWSTHSGPRWRISVSRHGCTGMEKQNKTHIHLLKNKSFSGFCVLCVLQGAALGAMVGQMTYGKRQFENLDSVMRRLIPPFHQAMEELLLMVDADSSAFNSYMVRNIPVLGSSLVVNSNYSSCIHFCLWYTHHLSCYCWFSFCCRRHWKCQRTQQRK